MNKTNLLLVIIILSAAFFCASGTASAISLSDIYVGNTVVDLGWEECGGSFSKYKLYRDDALIHTEFNRDTTFYRDGGRSKGVTYDYKIKVYNATGGLVDGGNQSVTTGDVHGWITQSTTWTAATSPYSLTGSVTVEEKATLTIQSGVTANGRDIYGTIAPLDSVTFNEVGIHLEHVDGYSIKNCEFNGGSIHLKYANGCSIKNCEFNGGSIHLKYANGYSIKNCVFNGSFLSGIMLDECNNGIISNNVVEKGIIDLSSSSNNTLIDNTVNRGYGIYLSGSSNTLTNNTANNNSHYGIYLGDSSGNNILTSNTANNNNKDGIYLSGSNNTLTGNTANNNWYRYGIYLSGSSNTLTGNTANNNNGDGIYLSGSNNTLTDNTANGNVRYYTGAGIYLGGSSNTLTGNTANNNRNVGIHLVGSSNTLTGNTANNNSGTGISLSRSSSSTLTGNTANNNSGYGIYLAYSSSNNMLTSNTANNNTLYGIYLEKSDHNTFTSNTVNYNDHDGIYLEKSDHNTFTSNTVNYNDGYGANGIYLYISLNNMFTSNTVNYNNDDGIAIGSFSSSNAFTSNIVNNNGDHGIKNGADNNTFTSNTANNNGGDGIWLSFSSDNTLSGNTANNNYYDGISLSSSGYTPQTNNNTLISNTANNNSGNGISLRGSDNNTLTGNTANNNGGDGINLKSSDNNTLTRNTANENSVSGINLEYGCSSNTIENNILVRDTTKGDSWSIYVGSSAENNIFKENTVGCNYPTKISFYDYHEGFKIRGVENPPEPPKPPEYLTIRQSISKYVEMENLSAETALFLDFHYEDKDVKDINEETLKVWKYNGTAWDEGRCADAWNGTRKLDTVNNIVGVEVKRFCVFAPLAGLPVHNINTEEDFETIQEAIDDVDTEYGHTITVDPSYTEAGTKENICVDKELTIKATFYGCYDTVIEAADPGKHVIEVVADEVAIQGFMIKGATSEKKAGVYIYGYIPIRNCKISKNFITGNYHGIYLNGASTNTIEGNIISGNTNGAGVLIEGLETTDNKLWGNYIGTDKDGTAKLPNNVGIVIRNKATKNIIGGKEEGKRNVISGNEHSGVNISDKGTEENKVVGNYIGTDKSGINPVGNQVGIWICNKAKRNTIGGMEYGAGNIISGNTMHGVYLALLTLEGEMAENEVLGNYIGVNKYCTHALPNGEHGVKIDRCNGNWIGRYEGGGNVISGNKLSGILIVGSLHDHEAKENYVLGNFIGTNFNGTFALPNEQYGVAISDDAGHNHIGGTLTGQTLSLKGNVISGNKMGGVLIKNKRIFSPSWNEVLGNYIGTNREGTSALANEGYGVEISYRAYSNWIGRYEGGGNIISGNKKGGVLLKGKYAHHNEILGNCIGTDKYGVSPLPNEGYGVEISDESCSNRIGGFPEEGTRKENIISGNKKGGVLIKDKAQNNFVVWNYIGTKFNGTSALPNEGYGIEITDGANDNHIGTYDGGGNVISGNRKGGILVTGKVTNWNEILMNYIGTDKDGTSALPNEGYGIEVLDGPMHTYIGNDETTHIYGGNLISGNKKSGILIGSKTYGIRVQGNWIGTNKDATSTIPNGGYGLEISDGSHGNYIGGWTGRWHEENTISGNKKGGILMSRTYDNQVWNNYIGTDIGASSIWTPAEKLPNGGYGIEMVNANCNDIHGNYIWYNCGGIKEKDSSLNTLYNNDIEDNTCSTGIHLDNSNSEIIGNTISNDKEDGIKCENGSNPTIYWNNIYNNTDFGLNNLDPAVIINAQSNWWGSSDGPSGAGPGSGDEVSDYVNYSNWLDAPIGKVPHIAVEKKVWDAEAEEWTYEIEADVDDVVRFQLFVHNDGVNCSLSNIVVNDTLPSNLEYADNATHEPDVIVDNKLTWNFAGPLEPCENITIEFDVRVTECGDGVNVVNATAWCEELQYGVRAEDRAAVNVLPSIEVDKKVWDTGIEEWVEEIRAEVGDNATFQLWIHHDGSCCPISGIVVEDTLPEGLEFVSAEPVPEEVIKNHDNSSMARWNLSITLEPCENTSIEMVANVTKGGELENEVSVNATGCGYEVSDTDVASVIAVGGALEANFRFVPTEPRVCQEVRFFDESTGGYPPYSYEWDFNNDTIVDSTEANPTWNYTVPGTYTVTLKVNDTEGNKDTTEKIITVHLPPNITSFAPPSPVNDTVCNWRTFNVTVNQTVNVSWYLNNTRQHTNVSTREASYTLHAEVVGEHNVSAVASNANGTDMQTWAWNVTVAQVPVLEINKTGVPDPVSPGGTLNYFIHVNNTGNANATNVTVTETYDANVTFLDAAPAPSLGNDTWQFPTLNVSETRWINISVIVNASVLNGTVLHNIVNVTCDEGVTDSDTENTTVFVAPVLNCTCGDICVNTTGWWRDGGVFNPSNTPIQHAVDNATAGETICVKDGTYNENVDVNKQLTIRSENGSANCIVNASDSSDHVFDVQRDYVNITGFTVENATENNKAGIYLSGREHCNISDNIVTNNEYGIYLYLDSNNNYLINNTASENKGDGFKLESNSNHNRIIGNNASDNDKNGIRLYGTTGNPSSHNTVANNTADLNDKSGIMIEGADSDHNTIVNNTCKSNDYGISIRYGDYNNLTNNICNQNTEYGIRLYQSADNNGITNNTAISNTEYGIYISSSDYNLVYNNYFNNTNNARDNGNNIWNITKTQGTNIIGGPYLGGNYWSDYAGRDINGDGLGDTLLPYNSSGDITNGGDYHPLVPVGYAPVLSIEKTDNPDPVSPGGTLNYSISVNNTGNATATNATVTETYDANVTFAVAVPAPSSGDDTWQFPTLNVSETRWINVSVIVNASVPNGTVLHNIVNVSCDEGVTDSDTADTTVLFKELNCTCGDLCVNETGWWRDGGAFNPSNTPIQHAVDNATAGDTICVKDGTYTENVDVNKSLTIRSEHGSASTTVQASNSNDHVFEVTADHVNVRGFTVTGAIDDGKAGIFLSHTGHCNVSGNNASDNFCGIWLSHSSNNSLSCNTADSNSYYGIKLDDSSNYNSLSGNTASNNDYGLLLSHASNNALTCNTANWNRNDGIGLYNSCNYNSLTSNTASNNDYGLVLESHSSNNSLSCNTADSNNDYGIGLYDSSNNLIYNNYFNNTNNAYDDRKNVWNTTKTLGTNIIGGPYLGGNYWSDYAGVDTDGDGLGNTSLPYNASGNIATGGDWHPLTTVGYAPPEIISFAPPSPVNDTVCNWRTFNITVNQTVNVSWYLNNTLQHTNVSTKEASYTLHAEVVGEHNVSAIASNENGTDIQSWVWNVTAAPLPVLEITKMGVPDPVSPGGTLNYTISANNTGNATATNVTVMETYDKNVTFIAAVPAPSSGDDTWQFQTLNVSETMWINISVTVKASVLNGTVLHNIVNVTCAEGVTDTDTADTTVFIVNPLNCTCGDICVNTTGWWRDGGNFTVSDTPIQDAIDNADAGDTICVKDGMYTENVDVMTANLTIKSENGSALTIVQAADSGDHVFHVSADSVTIRGFTVTVATGSEKEGICLGSPAANSCKIVDNHIWGYYQNWAGGILLQNASNNVISGNTVNDLCESAIMLQNANNNEISGNIVYDNGGGIRLRGSVTGNMISNNTLNDNRIGIELDESTGNVISGNTVHDSEYVIHLEESTENVISSNTVNGIMNGYGIWLTDSTRNVISGNTVYDNGRGILLQNASNNKISDNIVYDNSEGIRLYFNNDNEISGNTIMNNYFGIYLTLSNDTMISGNTVHGTEYGISLHDSNENEISGNTVNDTEYGINLVASCDNEITCNLVAYSKETGFRLTAWVGTSTGNTIENNNIIENGVFNEGNGGWEWNIQNEQSVDAAAENNYWGTTVSSEIAASILENPGAVDYEPFLSDLAPCAPKPPVDIGIKKSDNPDPVPPSGTLNYSIIVSNVGYTSATNVTVTETYDANVTFAVAVPAPSQGNDTWQFPTLNVSETRWINIAVTVNASVPNGTVLHNIVNVTCDEGVTDTDTADTTVLFKELNCTCGDLCVNETGWWQDGCAFVASGTPIQDAINNAIAGETICVKDGTYTENVDVNKSLTIRSEHGSASTTVQASNSNDHVFEVTADHVNIIGFTVTGAIDDSAGIYLTHTGHGNVSGNNASDNFCGIWLSHSSNNSLSCNTADSNSYYGIKLDDSSNYNSLSGNTASNNDYGLLLSHASNNALTCNTANWNRNDGIGLYNSSNYNSLTSNTASNNDYGLVLESHSSNNSLSCNTASNNKNDGIGLYDSSNNSLSCNTASNNKNDGIGLYDSSNYNSLTNNTASNNNNGIFLDVSSSNLIYNNYFNNTNNAYDDRNNVWNTTKTLGTNIIGGPYLGGNYWSDYAGRDTNGDGLGNTLLPYNASGNIATGGDWHPLTTVGYAPPEIISFAPPSPVNDTVCTWRTFNITVNQTVNVSWYLNNTLQHTNVSTKEASYTLHAEVVGEHNVSAIASNENGTDMQSWVWNVTAAPLPVLEINKTDNPDPVSPGETLNYTIRVNNTGNATATNVTVMETYDKNVTFVAAVPAPSSGDDTWQFPTLNVSETRWINISVTVNASVLNGTVLHNIVTVTCDEGVTDTDTENTTVFAVSVCVETAMGTGLACFATDSGTIEDLVAVDESTLPEEGKPKLVFPHGFFAFNITGLTQNQTVEVTLTLPDNVTVGTEYWKYHASEGGWIRIPRGSDDGDNVITITLVDGGLGDDDGNANGVIVDQGGPGVRATKPKLTKSAPTSVAPGGTITYTINYTNVGSVALTEVTITENYPEAVTFISAVPAPDAGTNNMWTIGTLSAGASGRIIIKVKVPDSRDLSFTETGSVTGEGFVMVNKDLSTEQKPYRLKNVVTISCAETDPVTASASTTVSGVPGTSLEITEHGSGIYDSEEILNLETKNKSIRLQKSTEAEYQPTSFYFSDGFSVVFTTRWMQDICSKNMVLGDAMHKKIKDATYIRDETKTETGEYGTEMEFASSFHGAAHICAVSKDVTTSEDYIGEFEIFWAAKEECQYLFNWSRVPGNDSEKLIRFLVDNPDINLYWAENATITKSDDDRIINISTDWHSAEVILAADNETATVNVANETVYVLDVRTEDGSLNLNVYDCRVRKISESVAGEGYVMVDKELAYGHIQVVEHGSGIYSSDTDFDSQRLNKCTEAEYQPTTFNFSDGFGVNFSSNWMQGICAKDKKAGTAIHKKISNAATMKDDTTATKSSMAFETSFNGSIHVGARTEEAAISEDYIGQFNVSQVIKIGDARSTSTSNSSNSSDLPSCP